MLSGIEIFKCFVPDNLNAYSFCLPVHNIYDFILASRYCTCRFKSRVGCCNWRYNFKRRSRCNRGLFKSHDKSQCIRPRELSISLNAKKETVRSAK